MGKVVVVILLFLMSILEANIGKFSNIKGDVTVLRDGKSFSAKVGDSLLVKDIVTTGNNAKSRMIFNDKTSISLGKNSHFKVENYKYDEKNAKTNRALFKVNKGIFRTITGKISKFDKRKFKLKTKTATIGIRGTTFSGIIRENKEEIFCERGEISVRSSGFSFDVKAGNYTSVVPGKPPVKPLEYDQDRVDRINGSMSSWTDKDCPE